MERYKHTLSISSSWRQTKCVCIDRCCIDLKTLSSVSVFGELIGIFGKDLEHLLDYVILNAIISIRSNRQGNYRSCSHLTHDRVDGAVTVVLTEEDGEMKIFFVG